MNQTKSAKIKLIISMVIFGTIGIFRKHIPLPSSTLAMARGFIGMIFLILLITVMRKKISLKAFKENGVYLILSGALIGFNWIMLFESYNYTSVAVATLCYYMAPIIVILLAPLVLKEMLNFKKIICVCLALIGMIFVSGVLKSGINKISELKGIFFGLGAALFYACVILLNKKIKNISPYDKTIFQLGAAAIVLLPYTILTEDFSAIELDAKSIFLVLFVGIVHTGFTYFLYFGSLTNLNAQTAALYSYIDPIFAILLSAFYLHEAMGFYEIFGMILILGSTLICEIPSQKHTKR